MLKNKNKKRRRNAAHTEPLYSLSHINIAYYFVFFIFEFSIILFKVEKKTTNLSVLKENDSK